MVKSKNILIAGIVPAAGRSRRLGIDKRLLKFKEKTFLETVVANMISGGCCQVIVVCEAESPCSLLNGLNDVNIHIVELKNESPSMLFTICTGIKYLKSKIGAAAIIPCDCPLVTGDICRYILNGYRRNLPLLFVPTFNGVQGHPRLLHRDMFSALNELPVESKFSDIFRLNHEKTVRLEVPFAEIIFDCDTITEYQDLLSYNTK